MDNLTRATQMRAFFVVTLILAGLAFALVSFFNESFLGSSGVDRVDPEQSALPNSPSSASGNSPKERQPVLSVESVLVVIVDEHTGNPISGCGLLVDESGSVRTDSKGLVSLVLGSQVISPADEFSFKPKRVSVDKTTSRVELSGQLRVRVTSANSGAVGVIKLVPDEAVAPPQLASAATVIRGIDASSSWVVIESSNARLFLDGGKCQVHPGHPYWIGSVTRSPEGSNILVPPKEPGMPTISKVELMEVGRSLEFEITTLGKPVEVSYSVDRNPGSSGAVHLVKLEKIAGGNSMVRIVSREKFGPSDSVISLGEHGAGTYEIQSMARLEQTIVVSNQRVEISTKDAVVVFESEGVGEHRLSLTDSMSGASIMSIGYHLRRKAPFDSSLAFKIAGAKWIAGLLESTGMVTAIVNSEVDTHTYDLAKSPYLPVD